MSKCHLAGRTVSVGQFWTCMLKFNLNNENETKSHIFPWHIFKYDAIFFLSKNIKVIQWLSKSRFLSCMTNVSPNNGKETKSDIFSWNIFKSDFFFTDCKILKYFNDFYNWHLSIS